MTKGKILCPSSICIEGSALIGVANSQGTVDLLEKPVPVTSEFIAAANESGPPPEARFRFANTCMQKGCKQWDGKNCGVITMVTEFIKLEEKIKGLPVCGIRQNCRWYLQNGSSACAVCQLVITDNAADV